MVGAQRLQDDKRRFTEFLNYCRRDRIPHTVVTEVRYSLRAASRLLEQLLYLKQT